MTMFLRQKFIARPRVGPGARPKVGPGARDADLIDLRNGSLIHDWRLRQRWEILTSHAFKLCLRARSNAGPGAFGWYFVMADGRAVSADAFEVSTREGRDNLRLALAAFGTLGHLSPAWRPVAYEINHDDFALYCAVSSQRIPSAGGIVE